MNHPVSAGSEGHDGRRAFLIGGGMNADGYSLTYGPFVHAAPAAVDPHAAQYGTPTRLLHAVDAGRLTVEIHPGFHH